jgi:hypothetical protein
MPPCIRAASAGSLLLLLAHLLHLGVLLEVLLQLVLLSASNFCSSI